MAKKPNFKEINWSVDLDEVILKKIEKARAKGAPIDLKNKDGRTILFDAIINERENIVPAILAMGANVYAEDNFGFIPLMLAVACKKESIYQDVVMKTTDIKVKEEVLFFAIDRRCDEERIQDLIISRGVSANAKGEDGTTPLINVVAAGNVGNNWNKSLIKFLIDHGANPTLEDNYGLTALGAIYQKIVWDKEVESILQNACREFAKSKQPIIKKTWKGFLHRILPGRDARC